MECSEDNEIVKSNAVVKYQISLPSNFARLQCNTDLNLPPQNWMNNIEDMYGLKHVLSTSSSGFSSFRMSNMFPDCIGEVDVVAGAENIKRLLKLPYSTKSFISMIVHRVGNTLLIDEFDIHKYLLRQEDDNWKWLRKFLYENVLNSLNEKERNIFLTHSPTAEANTSNLLSKFLCLSIKDTETAQPQSHYGPATLPLASCSPGLVLPEPNCEENVPDPKSDHVYNRNVLWTFEDIRMLIGTDMAIFGDKNRPCISLRLRDMEKPINVLTGIDYWLDNLMCNVPEVVMCFHVDGIVQKYELVKTEDLPHLENSKFSPKVIRNVAQNILSFLKSNATKAGHTYWLFKGRNDEVVKLYDLTTLCGHEENEPERPPQPEADNTIKGENNPFTIPVAMLLYTVAKNMKNSIKKIGAKQAGAIKTLLENCIKLLPKEKYPQIVASSHYILADLYIPAGIDPSEPKFDAACDDIDESTMFDENQPNSRSNSAASSDDEMDADHSLVLATKSIKDTTKETKSVANWNISPPPLTGDVLERCRKGLDHIYEGLQCLQFFETIGEEDKAKPQPQEASPTSAKEQIWHEELNPKMAKSYQPIPLPYKQDDVWPNTPTSSKTKPTAEDNEDAKKVLIKSTSGVVKSWNIHLKVLLFEKACLIYATLAEHSITGDRFGHALRHIYASVRSQQVVTMYVHTVAGSQSSCLLGRAGDIFCQFAKKPENMKRYSDEFRDVSQIDELIDGELTKDIQTTDDAELPEPIDDIEKSFIASCAFYEVAIKSAAGTAKTELMRRLASVWNELGLKYMFWAQDDYQKCYEASLELADSTDESSSKQLNEKIEALETSYRRFTLKSYDALKTGIDLFEKVDDIVNLSFLLCNMGRFFRFRAHIEMAGERRNDVRRQRAFYQNAFTNYQKALGVLGSRKRNQELWDMVTWEFSTSTFTLAKQLQDCSDKTLPLEEVEQEVMDMLQKALKLCDLETVGPRQVLYIFRSGLIESRIASLFHHNLRSSVDDSKRKNIQQLCRFHYEKAARYMESLNEVKDFLQIQIERIALQEFMTESNPTLGGKLKQLHQALDLFHESTAILEHLATLKSFENMDLAELEKLMALFEQRLQVILKTLIKICLTKKDEKSSAAYKQMYSLTLRPARPMEVKELAGHLAETLRKVKAIEAKT